MRPEPPPHADWAAAPSEPLPPPEMPPFPAMPPIVPLAMPLMHDAAPAPALTATTAAPVQILPSQPAQLRPSPMAPAVPRRWRIRTIALAGLSGLALFAAMSGFGRDVRPAQPLSAQLDQLLRAAGFGINEISISGHKLALDSEIYAALKLDQEGSILGFDVVAARRRIEDIAWVGEAQVVRVLPDKLRIQIIERRPIALWRHGEQQALIDATGRVLAKVARGSSPNLPVIAGTGAPEAAADLLGALELYPAIGRRIETATRIGQRRWSLALNDGSIVHLPEASARDALRRLAELDRRAGLLNRAAQVIDLRKHGLVAVGPPTRRAAAEPTPASTARQQSSRQVVE